MNTKMFQLNLDDACDLILSTGNKITYLLEGHMGNGKSSTLATLAEKLPTHHACYFDCNTKDLGDITIPKLNVLQGKDYVSYAVNEELGVHLDGPVIIMLDEYGKANPMVQNALLRLIQERQIGSCTLHPDSIVYATTNFGAEGVGDKMKAHALDRVTPLSIRKWTADEWVSFGIGKGFEPIILSWAKENPQLFQGFDEVQNPDDNPYIFHPKATRNAFVTPRSLEKASQTIACRDEFSDVALTAALIGTIGERGAMDLSAYVSLADELPSLADIQNSPMTAKVPTKSAALCMVIYRTIMTIDKSWVDAWMDYMSRIDTEAQAMFANAIRDSKDATKQRAVMTSRKFGEWAMKNGHMYTADKV